jgi:hypothetical protein
VIIYVHTKLTCHFDDDNSIEEKHIGWNCQVLTTYERSFGKLHICMEFSVRSVDRSSDA